MATTYEIWLVEPGSARVGFRPPIIGNKHVKITAKDGTVLYDAATAGARVVVLSRTGDDPATCTVVVSPAEG